LVPSGVFLPEGSHEKLQWYDVNDLIRGMHFRCFLTNVICTFDACL